MDPMTAMLAASFIGAAAGEMQGQKNRKALKEQQKEQAKRDKANLIASAYGLQPVRTSAPLMKSDEMLQGLFAGAQFGLMNENLWANNPNDPYAKLTPAQQQALMNTEAGMAAPMVQPQPQFGYSPWGV